MIEKHIGQHKICVFSVLSVFFCVPLGLKTIHHHPVNPNRIIMRLKPREEYRPRFVYAHVMLFMNANPQIKITREIEIEKKKTINRENAVDVNLKFSPELIVSNIDHVPL